jgi:hypothetical protein
MVILEPIWNGTDALSGMVNVIEVALVPRITVPASVIARVREVACVVMSGRLL